MRTWKIIFFILSSFPIFFIASLLAFYFHAGNILGYVPKYDLPDPKELDIYPVYAPFIYTSFSVWLITFPAWGILAVIYFLFYRRDLDLKPIVLSSIFQLFAIMLMFSGIFEWFVD